MRDDARVPPLSLLLGFGPAAILPVAALVAWTMPSLEAPALYLGRLWGAAILLFLAGVRRGLSFFTDGGPRPAQIATTMWLFLLGLAALVLPLASAFAVLLAGYGSVALLDPPAARRGEVPRHFARLRPPQMALAMAGLAGLMVRAGGL